MKNLFDPAAVTELKTRLNALQSDSLRQWGKMDPAQAMAHCCAGVEMALGEVNPPRALIGRLIGGFIKTLALGDDKPIRRNSPTASELVVQRQCDLHTERVRLAAAIDRFVAGGTAGCTKHPHAFFGTLTPDEWAVLMYKHLDHHLRQFGA
jgi:hypothetical protein